MPLRQEVVVKDVEMSFVSMVVFMVKWSLASIPAMIILVSFWFAAFVALLSVFGETNPLLRP